VALLAFYFFFIKPRKAELAEARVQVATEVALTSQLRSELARLQALQENEPKLLAELARIREFVPKRNEVPNFIFQVQDSANESGVDFVTITPELPKQPAEGATLAQVRVDIGTQGGYFAIQDFMRRLYDLDRALRIDVLTMTGGAGEPGSTDVSIAMSISARIFFELPASGAAPTGTTTTEPLDPAATASPTVSPSPAG
jgi:Tfp pilus assembly protein PilO